MRLMTFLVYYFATPFIAALIAKPLLNEFPNTEESIVLMWTFIFLFSTPALFLTIVYGGMAAKRHIAHPLNRLYYREARQSTAPEPEPNEHRKTSRRVSQVN